MKCYSLPYILRIKGEGVEGCYNCLPLQMGGGGGVGEVGLIGEVGLLFGGGALQ